MNNEDSSSEKRDTDKRFGVIDDTIEDLTERIENLEENSYTEVVVRNMTIVDVVQTVCWFAVIALLIVMVCK